MRSQSKKLILAALCAGISTLAATSVMAQFSGGATNHHSTVRELLTSGRDDQLVVLEGYIVDQVRHEDYRFRDDTGDIIVEIDDEVFAGQQVDPKTRVRIEGEYEKDLVEPNTVDVHRLTIVR